jgi:preprotein translocase subunit YajC
MDTLIFVVVIALFAWLFLVLPSRRRQRSHKAMQDSVTTGNEIITAGGIHGIVTEVGDEDVRIEIAEGVVVKIDRRAIAAVAEDDEEEEDDEDDNGDAENDDAGEPAEAENSLKG